MSAEQTPEEVEARLREAASQWEDYSGQRSLMSAAADTIAALRRERDEAIVDCRVVCDSYALENQRLFDRAKKAEVALASRDCNT